MGIGHRVKSINNPDMRVKIMKEFVKANFPTTPLLDYAMEVSIVYMHYSVLYENMYKTNCFNA